MACQTARNVGVVILSMGGERLDTRNPTSKLMLTILAGVATWEREIMKERQAERIAKAQADGKYKDDQPASMRPRLSAFVRQWDLRPLPNNSASRAAVSTGC